MCANVLVPRYFTLSGNICVYPVLFSASYFVYMWIYTFVIACSWNNVIGVERPSYWQE